MTPSDSLMGAASRMAWNAPSIAFYQSIGAHSHEGWYTYWLEEDAMKNLGET
jgi:hypothetical protein